MIRVEIIINNNVTDETFTAERLAHEARFALLNKSFEAIPVRESETVPAGALTKSAASYIQQVIVDHLRAILQKIKPNTRHIILVVVKRDYSFLSTRELQIDIKVKLFDRFGAGLQICRRRKKNNFSFKRKKNKI